MSGVEDVLRHWGVTPEQVTRPELGTMNEVFLIDTDQGRLVLRGHRQADREAVEAEHAVMAAARAGGVPAPKPLTAAGGDLFVVHDGRRRPAATFLSYTMAGGGRRRPRPSRETRPVQQLALTDGASIAYDVVGSGPPVLICHGGPNTTHVYMRDDVTPLATRCELIFWDYRGSGESDSAPAESYTFDRLADDAAELAASLGYEQFDVLAHSLGGFVALQCALRHPERVRRLALIDTAPSGNAKRMAIPTLRALGPRRTALALWRAARYLALWSWRAESDDRTLERFSIMATLQGGDPKHRAAVRTREILANNDNAPHLEKQSATFDVIDQLATIDQRTLVIYGSQDAPFVAGAQFLLGHLPDARAVRLEGCGHHPLVERTDEVLSELASFLTSV